MLRICDQKIGVVARLSKNILAVVAAIEDVIGVTWQQQRILAHATDVN